jgi:hypothetical protein
MAVLYLRQSMSLTAPVAPAAPAALSSLLSLAGAQMVHATLLHHHPQRLRNLMLRRLRGFGNVCVSNSGGSMSDGPAMDSVVACERVD